MGDWTLALHKHVRAQGELVRDTIVKVEGPLSASVPLLDQAPIVALIAAGSGVTPSVSILRSLMRSNDGPHYNFQRMLLSWSSSAMPMVLQKPQQCVHNTSGQQMFTSSLFSDPIAISRQHKQ